MITLKRYIAKRISTGETFTLLYLKVANQETIDEFKKVMKQ
jgi:hypothetical protein